MLSSKEICIFLSKIAAAQNEVAFSYHGVQGLYILADIFAAIIIMIRITPQRL